MKKAEAETAVWALTNGAANLGARLVSVLPRARLLVSKSSDYQGQAERFGKLAVALNNNFNRFSGHVFIMAAGIVVRHIAGLLKHKAKDPAVVVMDETGRWAISLVSGHLGGANRLARKVAMAVGAQAVITTATDCLDLPAIDSLAAGCGLKIANPAAIKNVSMALIKGLDPLLYDPENWLGPEVKGFKKINSFNRQDEGRQPTVVVSDTLISGGKQHLILHPPSLAVGLGCRKNSSLDELRRTLFQVLDKYSLARQSISCLATSEIKRPEKSIHQLADLLGVKLIFYSNAELETVADLVRGSDLVEKHVGVKSVCEAAAILAAGKGRLVVPKQKTSRVTVAVARKTFT